MLDAFSGAWKYSPASGKIAKIAIDSAPGQKLVWAHIVSLQRVIERQKRDLYLETNPGALVVLADNLQAAYAGEGFGESIIVG